jgi:hypothetical protein
MRMRSILISAVLLLNAGVVYRATAMEIGCGVDGLSDYSTAIPYKDAFRSARPWRKIRVAPIGQLWDYPHAHLGRDEEAAADLRDMSFDADGWPTEIPYNNNYLQALMLLGHPQSYYPFGTYTLQFEGTGVIYLGWDAGGQAPNGFVQGFLPDTSVHGHTVVGAGGTTTFGFSIRSTTDWFGVYLTGASMGINLFVFRSERSDPIRNIRVIIPDDAGGAGNVGSATHQPYNPKYLEDLLPFSCIRAMPLCGANNPADTVWRGIKRPGSCYPTQPGAPWHDLVTLANVLNRDMWITLPYRADNQAYMDSLAALFHAGLDPALKVYLEYGNEWWNGANPYQEQQFYAESKGWWWPEYQVNGSVRLFEAFERLFGRNSDRLVKVVSGWTISTGTTQDHLNALQNPTANPNGTAIDAYAVAPYFYGNSIATFRQSLNDVSGWLSNQHNLVVGQHGLRFLSYEGGQHQTSGDIIGVNSLPEMYAVYTEYMDILDNYLDMFQQFTAVAGWSSEYGAWGAKRYVGEPLSSAHKYRACYHYVIDSGQFDPAEPREWQSTAVNNRPRGAASTVGTQLAIQRHTLMVLVRSGDRATGVFDMRGRHVTTKLPRQHATGCYVRAALPDARNGRN